MVPSTRASCKEGALHERGPGAGAEQGPGRRSCERCRAPARPASTACNCKCPLARIAIGCLFADQGSIRPRLLVLLTAGLPPINRIPSQASVKDTFALVLNKVALFCFARRLASRALGSAYFFEASSHSFEQSQKISKLRLILSPVFAFQTCLAFRCFETSSLAFAFWNCQYNKQSFIAIAFLSILYSFYF